MAAFGVDCAKSYVACVVEVCPRYGEVNANASLRDWAKTPDRAANLSVPLCFNYPTAMRTHSSKQLQTRKVFDSLLPSIECVKEERPYAGVGIKSRGAMAAGEVLRGKGSNPREGRHEHTVFLLFQGESAKEQDNPILLYSAL